MENIEPYKSLRTVICEVQTSVKPTQPVEKKSSLQTGHKAGETWKTASGKIGAKNKKGVVDYFEDEDSAKAWINGQFKPAGRVDQPGDTSVPVRLDQDGYEVKKTAGKTPANTKSPSVASKSTGTTPKAQTVVRDTKPETQPQQPQGNQVNAVQSDTEEHPEVGKQNPKTEFDAHIKIDPKATEKAKFKPDIRKANVVAKAVKSGDLDGPQTDAESVFGDAAAEQRFVEEMNHAALSAMRGETAYDFELCSEVFAHLGLCFEPKTKKKVSKGIPRDQMPQFSSQVDPNRTDTPAFMALMRGKGYTSPDQVTPEDLKSEVNMEREYRKALEDAGYEVVDEEVSVTSLKPIQGQLKGEKIAGMYGTLAAAQSDPQNYGKAAARLLEPIYVSDGYVIDGHHRWAAQVSMDIANGSGANATMKTRTITKGGNPVNVDEIIQFSNKFQKDIGLLSQTRGGETIPEKKPNQSIRKEGYQMNTFRSSHFGRIVQLFHESVRSRVNLEESSKKKFDRTPMPGTFRSGMHIDIDSTQYYANAMKRSTPRKTDIMGNLIKTKNQKQKSNAGWAKSQTAVQNNIATAEDLINTINTKPVGTTFEIYGTKGGNTSTIKVKKVMKTGDVVFMVGTTEVELYAAGTGLQILNKKTRRIMLDRGDDMIWESADFTDVGRIFINEINIKLSDAELDQADSERKKRIVSLKNAADKKRAAEIRVARKFSKPYWKR